MNALAIGRGALAGFASGSRSLLPLAVTLAAGKSAWTGLAGTLATGEVAGDKLPFVPPRTQPIPLLGRALTGGFCGWILADRAEAARPAGAVAGAAAALAGAFAGYYARRYFTRELGIPDPLIAIAEDALVFGLARLANA